jgi:iron-sulfur cluster insertion protein
MNQVTQTAPSLRMTKACAERVRVLVEADSSNNPDLMLRVAVSGGGCSGFSYGFSLDAETTADDRVFQFYGSRLVVDETSLELLKGSEVDFVDDLMAASFRIKNPNATSTCGCGTSFSA